MGDLFDIQPDDWRRVRELLDVGMELSPAQREAWLRTLSAPDDSFKSQIAALLQHQDTHGEPGAFDTLPLVETSDFAPPQGIRGLCADQAIGSYRLIRPLGEGGMGSVWLARRADGLLDRQVALKLPRLVSNRAALAARMARERRILTALDHPHIARLYDAGIAEDGHPYLALEYVEGERIDHYCTKRRLSIERRLQLFLQVITAVAHAHSKLVVHRDLKPANILVSADGHVRLLDFGIAKMLDDNEAGDAMLTQMSGSAMTPDYASPEQVRGEAIGTASDIYSLGVVLFELLTDSRPYRLGRQSRAAIEEAVLQADVPRPSSTVVDAALRRTLRGDLDTIVGKALQKSADARYATANAFAEDIDRHLTSRPVLARPDSRWYRIHTFVRRNRLGVGVAAILVLLTVAGVGSVLWQARAAIAERRRAEDIKNFIVSIFQDGDPYQRPNEPLSVVAMLEQARTRVDRDLVGRPVMRVEMLLVIGESLKNLQANDSAIHALDDAVKISRTQLGPDHLFTLRARTARLGLLRFQGQAQMLKSELGDLLPKLRKLAADRELIVGALQMLAHQAIDEARYDDAIAAAHESYDLGLRYLGGRSESTANSAVVLALSLEYAHRLSEARVVAQKSIELAAAAHGGDERNAEVIQARQVLGRILGESGQLLAAIRELDAAVQAARAHFGQDAIEVGFFQHSMIKYLLESGEVSRARLLADEDVAIFTLHDEPGTYFEPVARMTRASTRLAHRDAVAALADARYAVEKLPPLLGSGHPFVFRARLTLALAEAYEGHFEKALQQFEALPEKAPDSSTQVQRLTVRSIVARLSGDFVRAVSNARDALAAIEGPRADVERLHVLPVLGLALVAAQHWSDVGPLLEQGLALSQQLQAGPSPQRADIWLARGQLRLHQGDRPGALTELRLANEYWQRYSAGTRWTAETAGWLNRSLR